METGYGIRLSEQIVFDFADKDGDIRISFDDINNDEQACYIEKNDIPELIKFLQSQI